MIAHEIAVVAGEHDHGVLIETEHSQPAKNTADGLVNHGDHAIGQRNRFAGLALGDGKRPLTVPVALILRALFVELLQVRRNRSFAEIEGSRQGDGVGIVHIPISSRRGKRMVRVGEGALDKKRPALVGARIVLQIFHRALGDVSGGIKLFGNARAPGLRRGVMIARQLVFRAAQRIGIGMARAQPAAVVSDCFIAVADRQLDDG